jgi:guanylate kinase
MTTATAAIVLYGPPASGKDTVTAELVRLDARYAPFQRLKVGRGNPAGYRLGTLNDLARLRAESAVLYENERYGNTYLVDVPELAWLLDAGRTPIVHMGQVAGVRSVVRYPARWTAVLLWCSRHTTAERAQARGSGDVDARLAAWDETVVDLEGGRDVDFTGRIDTDIVQPATAAAMIHSWVTSGGSSPLPTARSSR